MEFFTSKARMKENVQILPLDDNLPGIVLMFFENRGCTPDKPFEDQFHFVLYRSSELVGGLVILADDGTSVKIKHFHLHHELPHRYLCKKLARLAHTFVHEKGFSKLEMEEEFENFALYKMLHDALNEEMALMEEEALHHA